MVVVVRACLSSQNTFDAALSILQSELIRQFCPLINLADHLSMSGQANIDVVIASLDITF